MQTSFLERHDKDILYRIDHHRLQTVAFVLNFAGRLVWNALISGPHTSG